MIAFIDDHRGAHGVEPICKVLPIAPSTYHAHVAKRRDPAKLSARARQDAALKIEVRRVFDENFRVYGMQRYENALAETINGLYKTEVIHRRGRWGNFEAVVFATLEWVD